MAVWALFKDGNIVRMPRDHKTNETELVKQVPGTADGLRELQSLRAFQPKNKFPLDFVNRA